MMQRTTIKIAVFLVLGTVGLVLAVRVRDINFILELALTGGLIYQAVTSGLPAAALTFGAMVVTFLGACRYLHQGADYLALGNFICKVGLAGGLMGWAIRR